MPIACFWGSEIVKGSVGDRTGPFTISEPQNQEIGKFDLQVREWRAMDFEAPKLWKGRSGSIHESMRSHL